MSTDIPVIDHGQRVRPTTSLHAGQPGFVIQFALIDGTKYARVRFTGGVYAWYSLEELEVC